MHCRNIKSHLICQKILFICSVFKDKLMWIRITKLNFNTNNTWEIQNVTFCNSIDYVPVCMWCLNIIFHLTIEPEFVSCFNVYFFTSWWRYLAALHLLCVHSNTSLKKKHSEAWEEKMALEPTEWREATLSPSPENKRILTSQRGPMKAEQPLSREGRRADRENQAVLPELHLLIHLPGLSILSSILTREDNQRHTC